MAEEATEGAAPEAGAEGDSEADRLRKELEKTRREAARYRTELRQTQIAAEFGPDVAELVPKDLSPEEAKEYAQRLVDFRGTASGAEPEAQGTTTEEAAPEAAPSPLAAVSQPSPTAAPTDGRLSAQDIYEMSKTDPAAAALAWRNQDGRG